MVHEILTAYVWETRRGLLLVEADEDLLFFRALRTLRSARTVEELREVDDSLGLGMWERWYDLWSVVPSDEDVEFFDQWSDDSKPVHHWRDHPATASFDFELPEEDMPRSYDEWLPDEVVETLRDWMADDYLVRRSHVDDVRALLQEHGVRLIEEPALADTYENLS